MLHATLATLVMYYEQRFLANEMPIVGEHLREAYKSKVHIYTHTLHIHTQAHKSKVYIYTHKVSSVDDAHRVLIEWGAAIQGAFNTDNTHITGRLQGMHHPP